MARARRPCADDRYRDLRIRRPLRSGIVCQRRLTMSVDVVTFGCRLNAFESEVIRREAENAGLEDTIVINSCAVTNEAVAQARQSIRRLKRERPDARIVVTGRAAQTQPDLFANMIEVDRVVGNDDKMRGEAWRG